MTSLLLVGEKLAQDASLVNLVQREGFAPTAVMTAREALNRAASDAPGVVLIDHRLPDGDGIELLKTIRQRHPATEAVFVTPGGQMESAIEVLRAGALDYLRYPIDLQQLRVALGRARERRLHNPLSSPPVILVMEDHAPSRERLVKILEKEGYVVHAASDGIEGLELFHRVRIDIILMDLSMPRMGGLEVLAQTKGQGADVEVIVMTGYGDEQTVVQALRDGAINFLRKPIDVDQLLVSVEKSLEFQTARRSLLYRNRDVELMRHLVVRLTMELEFIVEKQGRGNDAVSFLHQFVDTLPVGVLVIDDARRVVYANRGVLGVVCEGDALAIDDLRRLGVRDPSDEALQEALQRASEAPPGTIHTVVDAAERYLVLTSINVIFRAAPRRYVGIVVGGVNSRDAGRS